MKNLIIDTNNLLYRIWHINKSVNGDCVSMFFRTLRSYVEKFEPDQTFSVWDKKLFQPFTNFRKELTKSEYKANRDYSEMEQIHANDKLIEEILVSLGIKIMYPRVMEGDDVIAWLAHNLPGETMIVSVDQDFCQLVNENVSVFSPIKKVIINPTNLEEYIKVRPDCFLRFKAIKGDVSDNIAGLDGFGAVKAKKLAENWDEYSHKLTEEQKAAVETNIKIVDLSYGYTVYPEEVQSYREQLKEWSCLTPNLKCFKEICEKNKLKDVLFEWDSTNSQKAAADAVLNIVDKLKLQHIFD